jgi:hypothetical protein
MSHGIKIYNDAYEEQVDGTYKNLSYHDSGVWSCGPSKRYGDFALTAAPPIIGVKLSSTAFYTLPGAIHKNANDKFFRTSVVIEGSASIPYVIFTEPTALEIPSGDYGIAIYNAAGELCFHNSRSWWRVVSVNSFWSPYNTGAVGEGTNINVVDANNNYFLLRPHTTWGVYASQINITMLYSILLKKNSATQVRAEVRKYADRAGYWYHRRIYSPLTLIEMAIG